MSWDRPPADTDWDPIRSPGDFTPAERRCKSGVPNPPMDEMTDGGHVATLNWNTRSRYSRREYGRPATAPGGLTKTITPWTRAAESTRLNRVRLRLRLFKDDSDSDLQSGVIWRLAISFFIIHLKRTFTSINIDSMPFFRHTVFRHAFLRPQIFVRKYSSTHKFVSHIFVSHFFVSADFGLRIYSSGQFFVAHIFVSANLRLLTLPTEPNLKQLVLC